MTASNQDILNRLATRIEEWSNKLAGSHRQLAETLDIAEQRIEQISGAQTPAQGGAVAELHALRDELARKEEMIQQLQLSVGELQSQLESLAAAEHAPAQAQVQELEARLEKTRD